MPTGGCVYVGVGGSVVSDEDIRTALRMAEDRGLTVEGVDYERGTMSICLFCSMRLPCAKHPAAHPHARLWSAD